MLVYFAAPLFTSAEREWNAMLAGKLRDRGIDVYLPQDEEPREKAAKAIFDSNVFGLNRAGVVVAVVDGSDPDSGTSWEVGYAHALGKPIVLVRTDLRSFVEGPWFPPFNLMLASSGFVVSGTNSDWIADRIEAFLEANG